jgi:hypothetical protein
MPLAGTEPGRRAHAHYRWAQRYAGAGNLDRAIPHFGRALYYGEAASSFGPNGDEDDRNTAPIFPDREKVGDLVSFAGLFYVDLPPDEARALASALVAALPDGPVDYRGYDRQIPKLQESFEALMRQRELPRSSGIGCYWPRCKTTPIEKLNTPDGAQVFCKNHAAVVRDNLGMRG